MKNKKRKKQTNHRFSYLLGGGRLLVSFTASNSECAAAGRSEYQWHDCVHFICMFCVTVETLDLNVTTDKVPARRPSVPQWRWWGGQAGAGGGGWSPVPDASRFLRASLHRFMSEVWKTQPGVSRCHQSRFWTCGVLVVSGGLRFSFFIKFMKQIWKSEFHVSFTDLLIYNIRNSDIFFCFSHTKTLFFS